MTHKAPKTYFTTEFHGGKRAVKARLRNLLSGEKKRRGVALLAVLLLAVSLCAGLVACNGTATTVEAIAKEVAGKGQIYQNLQHEFSTNDPIGSGTVCVYSMDVLRKATATDTPAGGAYIDDEGWFHEEGSTYLVLAQEGEKYTLVTAADFMIDVGSTMEWVAQHLLSLDSVNCGDTAYKLIARAYLPQAAEVMSYLTGTADTDETRTDENGVTWRKLSKFTKWHPDLRIDDQILSLMWYTFPREIGTELFNRHVYHPGGIFEEHEDVLWVRADAADFIGWDYTADEDTLIIVSGSSDRVEFTMEGTDHGQPTTWNFILESSMSNYWQFTKYFTLSAEGANTTDVSIDYGNSELYSQQDMNRSIAVIKDTFKEFDGCVLNSLTYAGDEVCKDNVAYCNSFVEDGNFTECMVFNSSFRSPKHGGGAWESDTEYTWAWYLAKDADGYWTLLTYGY